MSRPQTPATELIVLRKEQLTPSMVRIFFGGEQLAGFDPLEFTDRYVKLVFPPLPGTDRPRMRTYTIRRFDAVAGELTVDFVVHGEAGLAGPWARDAEPGDVIFVRGPGGGYRPDPEAPWHLLIGDASALPAIAAALEEMPINAPVITVIELEEPGEELALPSPANVELFWVYRTIPEDDVVSAVKGLSLPDGEPHVFLHGEAGFVKELRRWLRDEVGVTKERLSASGYWRRGLDDEGWRSVKRDYLA